MMKEISKSNVFEVSINEKDKNFPNEIKAIKNTPYQYRRISYEVLKDYCNGKYRKEKKHETKRVSKTIRTSV